MYLFTSLLLALAANLGGERMYVQNNWQFITLDPITGEVLDTKPLHPLVNNRGLIYDEGRLYFLDLDVKLVRDRILTINPATGRTSVVGGTGWSIDKPPAMAKDPRTGRVYIAFVEAIFELDKSTGAIAFVTRLKNDNPSVWVNTLAIDSQGRSFGIASPSGLYPRNRLYRLDLETGRLADIGTLNTGLGLYRCIAFDGSDQLWGMFTPGSDPWKNVLYKIDINTLAATEAFPLPQGAMGIAFGPAPDVESYCTAKTGSVGCVPAIDWKGHPSADASFGFEVSCSNVLNQSVGVLLVGTGGRAAVPFQGGTLCLAQPYTAVPAALSGGSPPSIDDCTGTWSVDVNTYVYHNLPVPAGTTLGCQWWGRDRGLPPPDNAQLSNALEVVLMP